MQFQTATPPLPPDDFAAEVTLQAPLRHIPAGDARIFEGWASLSTVDYQNHRIPSILLQDAAAEYMRKNPVIIWHHIPTLPIGRVLQMRVEDRGLYIRAEILQGAQIKSSVEGNVDFPSIALVADEVWNLIKSSLVRGLSIRLRKRGPFKETNTPLGTVQEVQEVAIIYEISVTPLPVNPGCQIDGANLLAKALPMPQKDTTMSELLKAQEHLLRLAADAAEKGQTVPQAFLDRHNLLTKAFDATPDPKANEIARLEAQIAQLKGQTAPPRAAQTMGSSTGAIAPPNVSSDPRSVMSKAIELAGDPIAAEKLGIDLGDLPPANDLMSLITVQSKGKIRIHQEINVSPQTQRYLQTVGNLAAQGKL